MAALAALLPAHADTADGFQLIRKVSGNGDRVATVKLPRGPVVVGAGHNGDSNFIVRLYGPGSRTSLVNEIGYWVGITLADEITGGNYRVAVQADGQWHVLFYRVGAWNITRSLLGLHQDSGSDVVAVRSPSSAQLVVTGTHSGSGNFIVKLVGVGSLTGSDLLFNEIGPYRGQRVAEVPRGPLLLWVQADGRWSLRFTR